MEYEAGVRDGTIGITVPLPVSPLIVTNSKITGYVLVPEGGRWGNGTVKKEYAFGGKIAAFEQYVWVWFCTCLRLFIRSVIVRVGCL